MDRHRFFTSFSKLVAARIAKRAVVQVLTKQKAKNIYPEIFFPPVLLFETVPCPFRGHLSQPNKEKIKIHNSFVGSWFSTVMPGQA